MMNLSSPKLSLVITPGTNDTRRTLPACLAHLSRQTIAGQMEILVVMPLRFAFAARIQSERIRSSFKKMQVVGLSAKCGFAACRNAGLQRASAEWLGFFDSEERVSDDHFERMLSVAERLRADAAVCDVRWKDREMIEDYPLGSDNLFFAALQKPVPGEPCVLEAPAVLGSPDGVSPYNKIFRRSGCTAFPFVSEEDNCAAALAPLLAAEQGIAYVPGLYAQLHRSRNTVRTGSATSARFAVAEDALQALNAMQHAAIACRQITAARTAFPALAAIICDGDAATRSAQLISLLHTARRVLPAALLGEDNPFLAHLLKNGVGWERKMFTHLKACLREDGCSPEMLFACGDFNPKVSIVIPVYNGKNYLREAINSALAQTYPNTEVIVVNDGSSDGGTTETIAKEYGNRIRYFHKENGGVATALNLGIQMMTGMYFSWLSHDDVYAPHKIENQMRWLAFSDDPALLIAEGFQVIDEYTQYQFTIDPLQQYRLQRFRDAFFAVTHWCINGCAILIHKSHFDRVGCFNPQFPTTQDYELWTRMLLGQKLLMIGNIDLQTRSHAEQGRYTALSYMKECNDTLIRTMDAPNTAAMENLDGTVYNYYRDAYCFAVSEAQCVSAALHARSMAEQADPAAAAVETWAPLCHASAQETPPTYSLYRSASWRLTKPLRAWKYARKPRPDSPAIFRLFLMYMVRGEMDRQSDETIRAGVCWRITKPLRLFSAMKRRSNRKETEQ